LLRRDGARSHVPHVRVQVVFVSRSQNRLKKLTKLIPDHKVTAARLTALELGGVPEADRAIAVVGGAFVENALKVALIARCHYEYDENAVFGHNGPLSFFSTKIIMGHALAIYGPMTQSDLDIIRNIRNTFAHALADIDFQNDDIVAECSKLHHVGKRELATFLRGAKALYVRAVINISDALRSDIATLGVLGRYRRRSLP
jgi:hypothetical protein